MNDTEQRMAIAEACGIIAYDDRPDYGFLKATGMACCVPDYLNDLNACREAWRTLDTSECAKFAEELAYVVLAVHNKPDREFVFSRCSLSVFANANPRERAEAFLRCKGLWKEEHEPISG